MSNTIPGEILTKALELRAKNGLEATEQALLKDLETSKAKWTVEETPRYRRAGDSPIWISGKYLTSYGVDPATGEKDLQAPKAAAKRVSVAKEPAAASAIDQKAVIRVLAGKGFQFVRLVNELTGEILKEETDPKIDKLQLEYSSIPTNASHEKVYVTQTSPQIQVSLTLERFLELTGTKP